MPATLEIEEFRLRPQTGVAPQVRAADDDDEDTTDGDQEDSNDLDEDLDVVVVPVEPLEQIDDFEEDDFDDDFDDDFEEELEEDDDLNSNSEGGDDDFDAS